MLSDLLAWARKNNHLSHGLIASIMWACALMVLASFTSDDLPWIGLQAAILPIGFYWGREKRDAEITEKRKIEALGGKADAVDLWSVGWLPWQLDADGLADLLYPTATCLLLGAAWFLINMPN